MNQHPGAERPATVGSGSPSLDGRDWTAEPPAYLDPRWVIVMRRRLAASQVEGYRPWPYWEGYAL